MDISPILNVADLYPYRGMMRRTRGYSREHRKMEATISYTQAIGDWYDSGRENSQENHK